MRLSFLFPVAVAAAALVAPRDASACSFPRPAFSVYPLSGSSYPANAALMFYGHTSGPFNLDDFEVLVDDAPARLVSAESLSTGVPEVALEPPGFALVSPEPRAGQRVVLRGNVCGAHDPDDPENNCPLVEVTYTATAPDTTAPALPDLRYSVELDPGCNSPDHWAYVAHFPPPRESAASAPVMYLIEGFTDATLAERMFVSTHLSTSSGVDVELTDASESVGCVRVRAFDLAGNEAESASVSCDLPPGKTVSEADEEVDPDDARRPNVERLEDPGACQLSGGPGARSTPWAWLLAASALFVTARRRRRAAGRPALRARPPSARGRGAQGLVCDARARRSTLGRRGW